MSRGRFAPCEGIWCGPCHSLLDEEEFQVRESLDDDGVVLMIRSTSRDNGFVEVGGGGGGSSHGVVPVRNLPCAEPVGERSPPPRRTQKTV